MSTSTTGAAALGDLEGNGYAVVESLASLGKGRRLIGLLRVPAASAAAARAQLSVGRRLAFRGPVHFRHHSVTGSVDVEIVRVEDEADGLLVEFVAWDVPYGMG